MPDNSANDPPQSPQERLLAALQEGGDFPALSRTIAEINRTVSDDYTRANALTDTILRDVALTNKLLRLVNAAIYGSFGGQPISTISRAIVILGFDAVRDAAISLMLFEHLKSHAQADELKAEAVEAFFCGMLGRLLANRVGLRDAEEAFICALFRNMGRLMMRFHFYEATQRIQQRVAQEGIVENIAASQEFGLDYDQIGLAIAKHWHLPPSIQHAMGPLPAGHVHATQARDEKLKLISNLARELHRDFAAGLPPADEEAHLKRLAQRFADALPVNAEQLRESVSQAAEHVMEEAASLQVDVFKSPLIKRLLRVEETRPPDAPPAESAEPAESNAAASAANLLSKGLQDLTSLLIGNYQIADVMKLVAELFYRCGCFDRVALAAFDPKSQALVGRLCHGDGCDSFKAAMRIPLAFAPDVFHAAIAKGQDILISDASADNIRTRIPAWHQRTGSVSAFLLLPLLVQDKPLALIYADRSRLSLNVSNEVLNLLKALRNQAILAVRQKM
jgi:HD-like signal output (HDOD) protein